MLERLEKREIARRGLVPGPGERPRPDLPAGSDLIPKIGHIVVLMMENHSYDNYLGMLAGRGDGLKLAADGTPLAVNVLPDGQQVPAHHLTSTVQIAGNPSQTWNASHISYADGTCGGFATGVRQTVTVRTPPCRWATGPRRTCPSTTGSPARSPWPTAGSAPAWGRRSRTGGS